MNFAIKLYDNLRIMLILSVVLIHVLDFCPVASSDSIFYIKESLLRSIVPVFFYISGFFFFQNINKFSLTTYKHKIQSRIKTLFIPYFIWNIVALLFCVLSHSSIQMGQDLSNFTSLTLLKLIKSFWNLNGGMPVYYPFWFIKYLMIIILPTPAYYYLIKKIGIYFPILLLIIYLTGCCFGGICPVIIFYTFCFCLGAYSGISPKKNSVIFHKKTYLVTFMWAITSLLDLKYKLSSDYIIIHGINMATGMIAIISIASKFYQHNNKVWFPTLKKYTFIIYALHAIFIPSLYIVCQNVISNKTILGVISNIIVVYICTIMTCVLIGYILNKYFRKIYLVSIGSR